MGRIRSRKRLALRWLAIAAVICVAYAIAAASNPSLVTMPVRMVLGDGQTTLRAGVASGRINGNPVTYDIYPMAIANSDETDRPPRQLLLLLKSGNVEWLFSKQLLVQCEMLILPNRVDTLKLPFGILLTDKATGVEVTSKKVVEHPVLEVEAIEGYRQYRFSSHGRDPLDNGEFVLNIPSNVVYSCFTTTDAVD